jgi:hypothetical protein
VDNVQSKLCWPVGIVGTVTWEIRMSPWPLLHYVLFSSHTDVRGDEEEEKKRNLRNRNSDFRFTTKGIKPCN